MGGCQDLLTDLRQSGRGDPGWPTPHHRLLFGGGKEKGAEDVLLYAWLSKYIIIMMCVVFSIFSHTAPEPKSHDHAPTSPSLNEGSLVAKK